MSKIIIRKLIKCPRCDDLHDNLEFKPFTNPPKRMIDSGIADDVYTHFSLCPVNGEPILLYDVED